MTFPSSGSITASTINSEIGQASTTTLGLDSTSVRDRFIKPGSGTTISYSDAYEFVLTITSTPTTTREPSSGSNYTQNSTDFQYSTYYGTSAVNWGGVNLVNPSGEVTSWTSGTTTYFRDTLVTTAGEGYGTRYYYRIYRTLYTPNILVNPDVRQLAVNAGWNQSMRLVVVVSAGTRISANSTINPAMSFTGSFPNGVILMVMGGAGVYGMGGRGGDTVSVGSPGGNAINNSTALRVYNYGTIAGGGGGGGAGVYWSWNGYSRSMAGSGGASGSATAPGGNNPSGANGTGYSSQDNNADGIYETPGPSFNWGWGGRASSPGGKGGAWGTAGDAGGTVDGVYNYTGYAGGAGGKAINNTGTITWGAASGTTYGATA